MHKDDRFYRHERLTPGAFTKPGTVHLHFELGPHRDVQRMLCEKLVEFGATPKESCIVEPATTHLVSCTVSIGDQLGNSARPGLRLIDDLQVEPCSAQLERVLAHIRADRAVQVADTDGLSDWTDITAGYTASYPGTIEVHHSVCFPKNGTAPPLSLLEVAERAKGLNIASWAMFAKPDVWCFRSSKPIKPNGDFRAMLEREHAKLASLYTTDAPDVRVTITVEQNLAMWNFPLQPSTENRNRLSFSQAMGTPEHRLPNWADVMEQCNAGPGAERMLVRDEPRRSRIIGNLEPFRRVVQLHGFDPLVLGIALIPVVEQPDGRPRFADQFCSQVAAYAEAVVEAEILVDAYQRAMHFLVKSDQGPILAYNETYERVFSWNSSLSDAKPTQNPSPSSSSGAVTSIAAGEQVFALATSAVKQYKTSEEVMKSLMAKIALSPNSRLSSSRFMMIPFKTANRAAGEHLRGALFMLLSDSNGDDYRRTNLATGQRLMLMCTPWQTQAEPVVVAAAVEDSEPRPHIRIQQAIEHDKLWTALDFIINEPYGTRLQYIANKHPDAFALFKRYPKLESLRNDIEHANKLGELPYQMWDIISGGLSRRRLFYWRERAGLPSRRK